MTATEQQYLNDINYTLVTFVAKSRNLEKIGSFNDKRNLETMLLSAYVKIMNFYFRDTNSVDTNLMTTDEANTIMEHINRLANTIYWIDL